MSKKEKEVVQPEEVKNDDVQSEEDTKEIKVIETIIESKAVAPEDVFGKLSRQQIDLMKRTIAKGASDDELKLFIQVCKGSNLNPFLKQAHLVPRWDSSLSKEVRAIQISIDGYRSIAESTGAYAGNDDPIFTGDEEISYGAKETKTIKVPLQAKVTVQKIVDGKPYPFSATARWSEYYPGPKMGFQWHIRPYLMLGKCAEALALRKAFPKQLSGMYIQEEFDKTNGEQGEEKKKVQGLDAILAVIKRSSKKELDDYQKKMIASKKYTPEQKQVFMDAINKRIEEIGVE